DRSFVGQMEMDDQNRKIVNTIITLSQQLGLNAIAEGIETPQQLEILENLDCQFGQGYLFSPPLSAQDIESKFLNCAKTAKTLDS
ncbi:MAG: EAL domain-containing protein, partial [Cyanobacteria bacterium J06638_22]